MFQSMDIVLKRERKREPKSTIRKFLLAPFYSLLFVLLPLRQQNLDYQMLIFKFVPWSAEIMELTPMNPLQKTVSDKCSFAEADK